MIGLASGMDIDQIVKNLMNAERMPLDKLKQKKQILEWQRDDFREINTRLLSFRNELSDLKLTRNYRARTAVTSDESKLTASVTSGASQASYTISEVKQLASAATKVNAGAISEEEQVDLTKSLRSQQDRFVQGISWSEGVVESKSVQLIGQRVNLNLNGARINEINVKVDGETYRVITEGVPEVGEVLLSDDELIFHESTPQKSTVKVDYAIDQKTITKTIDPEKATMKLGKGDIARLTIDNETFEFDEVSNDGIVTLGEIGTVNTITGEITFNGDFIGEEGKDIEVTFSHHYTKFSVGSHTSKGEVNEQFFVHPSQTMNDVIRQVNESNAGVTMFYDSFSDQLTLTRKETGSFNQDDGDEIILSGDFINKVLQFEESEEIGGENAKFTINGLETERHTNTFDMNGVTISLKRTFTEPVSVSINYNTDEVVETIKSFVDQYNEVVDEISKKLNEERHRSYQPLTEEERDELSERQQEKWEELAKSGLLKGDSTLSSALSQMRMTVASPVETNGLYNQLATIGISTTANYLDPKLELNEDKLREALEKDPESVENLFRGNGPSEAETGVIHKLYDHVNETMAKIQNKAGRATSTNHQFALGRKLLSVDQNIDRFEEKLQMVENRYWRQFTAMEKAIQRANEQSAYLMQQFGGM